MFSSVNGDAALTSGLVPEPNDAGEWLDRWSLQLGQLSRPLLADVDRALGLGDSGQPLSPSTSTRFRKVSRACVRRAVELGLLDADPWPPSPRGRSQRKALRGRRTVNVRALPDPATMAQAIEAIASHQPASRTYQVMTAVAYYAGLRPSEVVMLRALIAGLAGERLGPHARDGGRRVLLRARRAEDRSASVPIPPVLVERLRSWIIDGGYRGDDLLFRTRTGSRPAWSNWSRSLPASRAGLGRCTLDAGVRLSPCRCDDLARRGGAARRGGVADGPQRRDPGDDLRRGPRRRRSARPSADRSRARRPRDGRPAGGPAAGSGDARHPHGSGCRGVGRQGRRGNYGEYRRITTGGLGVFAVSVFAVADGVPESTILDALPQRSFARSTVGAVTGGGFGLLPTSVEDPDLAPDLAAIQRVHFDIALPALTDDRLVTIDPLDDEELEERVRDHLRPHAERLLALFGPRVRR